MRRGVALVAVVCCSLQLHAQPSGWRTVKPKVRQYERQSAYFSVGYTNPLGRSGLREFWLSGPSATIGVLIHTDENIALGVGSDFSILFFDEAAFGQRWPGVAIEKRNLVVTNLFLNSVYIFLPGSQTRPYASVQLGAEFIPEALYQKIIDGVRNTYYKVGGTARLALGVAAGVNIQIESQWGLTAELKTTMIHNDPNASFFAHLRAGVQYKF
jgi:hypothetical protein